MSSQDETCLLTKLHGGLLEAIKTFQKTSIEKEAIDSEGLLTSLLDHIMPTTRSFGNKKPTKVRDSYADKVINTVPEYEVEVTNPMVDEDMHSGN